MTYTNKQLGIEINGTVNIRLSDDSASSNILFPKNQKETINKVLSWLTEATLYKAQIPKPNFSETIQSAGNMMPSHLVINWGKHSIILQPANYFFKENEDYKVKYVENIVSIEKDGQKNYIESQQLYRWLKNDEWTSEFTTEYSELPPPIEVDGFLVNATTVAS
jgi:hypothetical protein